MTISANKVFSLHGIKAAGDGTPVDDELSLINGYSLKELKAEDVYARSMYLAHNGIDRDNEAFSEELLNDFVRTLPGKGFFVIHPASWGGDGGPGEGRFFKTELVRMPIQAAREILREPDLKFPPGVTEAVLLKAGMYMLRLDYDVNTRKLIDKFDGGTAGDVSIGFNAAGREPIEDGAGTRIGSMLKAPGEALEGSTVWLGSQNGARLIKALNNNENHEDNDMTTKTVAELQTDLDKANTKNATLQTELEQHQASTATLKSITDAVGEESIKDPAAMKQSITDGKAYRAELIEGVCKAKRLLGLMGDKDEDMTSAKSFYAGMSIDMLKSERDAMVKKLPDGAQLEGGDPNATGADEGAGTGKGLRDASVTGKSMETMGLKKAS